MLFCALNRYHNNAKIVKLLIGYGADVNCRDINQQTVLHEACHIEESCHLIEYAQLLVEVGADIDARDKDGETVFFHLLYRSNFKNGPRKLPWLMPVLDATAFFLQAGASVEVRNTKGKTALDVALRLEIEEGPERSKLLELLSYDTLSRESFEGSSND